MRGVSVIRQCVPNRRGEGTSPNELGNPTPTVDFGELINVGAGLVPAQNTGSSPTTGQPQVERSEIPILSEAHQIGSICQMSTEPSNLR